MLLLSVSQAKKLPTELMGQLKPKLQTHIGKVLGADREDAEALAAALARGDTALPAVGPTTSFGSTAHTHGSTGGGPVGAGRSLPGFGEWGSTGCSFAARLHFIAVVHVPAVRLPCRCLYRCCHLAPLHHLLNCDVDDAAPVSHSIDVACTGSPSPPRLGPLGYINNRRASNLKGGIPLTEDDDDDVDSDDSDTASGADFEEYAGTDKRSGATGGDSPSVSPVQLVISPAKNDADFAVTSKLFSPKKRSPR